MNSKKADSETGIQKQPFLLALCAALFTFGGLAYLLTTLPVFSISFFRAAVFLGSVGGIFMLWMNFHPSLGIKGILFADLITFFTLIPIRVYSHYSPDIRWLWVYFIPLTSLIAFIIPVINRPVTIFLRTELTSPKTPMGEKLYVLGLFLGPIGGLIGTLFGIFSARSGLDNIINLLFATILWMIAIFLPFSSKYPISPLEKR